MDRRTALQRVAVLTMPALAGCGGDGGNEPTATETVPVAQTVEITEDGFSDANVTITNVGEGVEWVNNTDTTHTIVSAKFTTGGKDWEFETTVEGGGSAATDFEEEGVYEYQTSEFDAEEKCGVILVGSKFNTPAYRHPGLPCEENTGGL